MSVVLSATLQLGPDGRVLEQTEAFADDPFAVDVTVARFNFLLARGLLRFSGSSAGNRIVTALA